MPDEGYAARLADEVHRFFPEWADRPPSADTLTEADHNSYLAGGYSEEFGYRVRPDQPPIFPLLHEDPERARQWSVQIGCLHSGYPECPRPADRLDHLIAADRQPDGLGSFTPGQSDGRNPPAGLTRILRVDRSGADRHAFRWLAATMLWTRLRVRSRVRDRGI